MIFQLVVANRRDAQVEVLDANERLQPGCELLDLSGFALRDYHLEAVVMCEMYVLSGDHELLIVVLYVEYFTDKFSFVMAICHHDYSCDNSTLFPLLDQEVIADKVSDGFRAVAVVSFPYMPVKGVNQGFLEGNSEAV